MELGSCSQASGTTAHLQPTQAGHWDLAQGLGELCPLELCGSQVVSNVKPKPIVFHCPVKTMGQGVFSGNLLCLQLRNTKAVK